MVGIKDFGMPSCCMNCEMFDGEYGNCDIMGDTQDFEYQWDENRPFDCPLVEAIPKDQYEARLKADMVAILTDLKLEIEECVDGAEGSPEFEQCVSNVRVQVVEMIQDRINTLGGVEDGNNNQHN